MQATPLPQGLYYFKPFGMKVLKTKIVYVFRSNSNQTLVIRLKPRPLAWIVHESPQAFCHRNRIPKL